MTRALNLSLTNKDEWTNELVNAWSRVLLGIHLRHPAAMPELRAAALAIWNKGGPATQIECKRICSPEDPATFEEYLALHDPTATTKIIVNMVIKAFDNETVIKKLNKIKKHTIDVSSSPYKLLLSDRPVCFTNLQKPNGLVLLPLSPSKLFVAANDELGLSKIHQMPIRDLVKNMNVFVAGRARKFVWSADHSQENFLKKRMSKELETLPLFPNLEAVETPAVAKEG